MIERCKTCGHPRHAHGTGRCSVKRVDGPAVNNPASKAEKHPGRRVTPCTCDVYVSPRNGVEVH